MIVVSAEVFEQLMHPERKPRKKLEPNDLVARDSFTGEKMNLVSQKEFFKDISRRKTGKRRDPVSARQFFDCAEKNECPKVGAKGHLFSAKEYFEMTERKGAAKTEKRRAGTKKEKSK